jgi:hypothetical protein
MLYCINRNSSLRYKHHVAETRHKTSRFARRELARVCVTVTGHSSEYYRAILTGFQVIINSLEQRNRNFFENNDLSSHDLTAGPTEL